MKPMTLKTVTIASVEGCAITGQLHIVDVPPLCTRTHNPLPGSAVSIRYAPVDNTVLEVYSLTEYVHGFVGSMVVRDIEQFAQVVAADCGKLLGVEVGVAARFVLNIGQIVETTARWRPFAKS
jgi:hypothetical protein